MTYYVYMNGNEFLKKLKKYAKKYGISGPTVELTHGKGSHSALLFNNKRTTLKDRTKEIGSGLLTAMLSDLDIKKREF